MNKEQITILLDAFSKTNEAIQSLVGSIHIATEPGALVRMTENYRSKLWNHGSLADGTPNDELLEGNRDHVREFGSCIGVVQGLTKYVNTQGPEVDVRWRPSMLRYAYHPDNLEILPRFTEFLERIESEFCTENRCFHILATRYILGVDTEKTLRRLAQPPDRDYRSGNEFHRQLLTNAQVQAILEIDLEELLT